MEVLRRCRDLGDGIKEIVGLGKGACVTKEKGIIKGRLRKGYKHGCCIL